MAVTIVLSVVDMLEGIAFLTGSIADEQNTGERIIVDFSALPPGAYFIFSLVIRTSGAPSTIPDLDPPVYAQCFLQTPAPAKNIQFVHSRVFAVPSDGSADGAPTQWAAQWDFPFAKKLDNVDWSIQANVPPADANASPISNFICDVVAGFEREG